VILLRLLRIIWAQLSGRGRVAVALATLVLIAVSADSIASLSSAAGSLAVLLVAAGGLWMILRSPFRGRV
jgi:hypothetical protein